MHGQKNIKNTDWSLYWQEFNTFKCYLDECELPKG